MKTSPAGYINIRAASVDNSLGAPVEQLASAIAQAAPVVQAKAQPNPVRVGLYIKLAVEMLVAAPKEGKNVEENLCENIQEIKKLEEFTIGLFCQ